MIQESTLLIVVSHYGPMNVLQNYNRSVASEINIKERLGSSDLVVVSVVNYLYCWPFAVRLVSTKSYQRDASNVLRLTNFALIVAGV